MVYFGRTFMKSRSFETQGFFFFLLKKKAKH